MKRDCYGEQLQTLKNLVSSWYQLEVGDIVTYNYATEKNIEIGRFGLGYNKDSGEGSNEPAGSIVLCFSNC